MEANLTFTPGQWNLVFAAFVMAMFALLAGFVYFLSSRSELGARYRPIGTVSALVPLVAFVAYGLLALSWVTGFSYTGTSYVPSGSALQFSNGYRYVDWSVTVPLLTVELVGVLAVAGTRARSLRATWMSLAFVMIVTGFLGAEVFGYNDNNAARLVWGTISSIPMAILYVMFFKEVKQSRKTLSPEAGRTLQNTLWLLVAMWGVYPLAYLVPVFFNDSAGWGVGRQLAFTLADVIAKVGYAALIHKILKLRSAEDVRNGTAPNEEPIWLSNDLLAPAVPASASALAQASPQANTQTTAAGRHTAQTPASIDLDEQSGAAAPAEPRRPPRRR